MLGKAKDKMIGAAAKRILEGKLGRYGEVVSFAIESSEKRLSLDFLPAGEEKSIKIDVGSYRIFLTEDGASVCIEEITADREWVANLLEDFVAGKEFALGAAAAKMVDWIL